MDITERFLNYTKFDTQSAEDADCVPSTAKQLVFAEYLKKELEAEGLDDVEMDDKGYIYATLKANTKASIPTIGFISHYDTSPDCSGADIKARIVPNYNGKEIVLSEGIIPAPESCHAIAATIREALKCKETGEEKVILFNLSGHGLIDMPSYESFIKGDLQNYTVTDEMIAENLKELD